MKNVFKDFNEYYSLTKNLNIYQRQILFCSLSKNEQNNLLKSFYKGKWQDLLMKNQVDHLIDSINELYNINLLDIRVSVCSGKIKKVNKDFWHKIKNYFNEYDKCFIYYVFGNIDVIDLNSDYFLLVSSK